MHDKSFWEGIPNDPFHAKRLERLKKDYATYKENDKLEAFKYSEFKMFFTVGNRTVYQTKFQSRRNFMHCAALLCLMYPEEQEYLDTLMDVIYALCDEYTWCQPAHQGKLEPNNNTRIDISASILGSTLAKVWVLLGDRLEPLIRNRIYAEVNRRVIEPFTSVENYGWWENGTMNWTAVCMGNVAVATMLMRPDLADEAFIARSVKSIEGYLTGFDESGICFEGCGYWNYGFSNFCSYADVLRRYTDGKVDFFKREKVKKIASFYQKTFISDNVGVSFSDCGGALKLTYPTALIHFLKNEYPDDVLVYDPKYGSLDHDGFGGYVWTSEELQNSAVGLDTPLELYSQSAGWLIKKTPFYGFAAKGGHNNEFHNHNDVGTFIYAKNGRQIISDIGGGIYTRQYFQKETRYGILECRSGGHSLPIVNGQEQKFGSAFAASGFDYADGTLTMDIAGAYGMEELTKLQRSFTVGQDSVTLTDTFEIEGDAELICRLIAVEDTEIIKAGELKIADAVLTYDPETADCTVEIEESSRGLKVKKIDFKLKKGVRVFTCTLK